MAAAPVILTSEELATREARNVVMVSSEEILPRKIPAYVSTPSEISFMFRQPSASAILINKPYIELELQFHVTGGAEANVTFNPAGVSANGRLMEGLPFLTKCVRTSVVSINGATQTYRNSEYFTSYLRTQMSRAAMKKINVPFNEMNEGVATMGGNAQHFQYRRMLGPSDSQQMHGFLRQYSKEGIASQLSAAVGGGVANTTKKLPPVTIREPLFMGVFGGLAGNDSFPLWSCEQNKSPSLLHVQQCTINFNMLDNWAQNLCGLLKGSQGNQSLQISGVTINKANLCCTYVQPPPKYIASALASNVTYASYKMLRFETTRHSQSNDHIMKPVNCMIQAANHAAVVEWTLDAVSFQYMPSTFLIEIAPDYNTKSKFVEADNFDPTANIASFAQNEILRRSKEDRRMGIVQLDLIINTSPDVVPSKGKSDFTDGNIINLRYNARQLYELYLKNSASVERAIYTFDEWFYGGCVVILSPQDMNGILPSQHIRGNISIQGTIYGVNTLGYSAFIGSGQPTAAAAGNNLANGTNATAFIDDEVQEKFRAQITGVYSNCYLALDAKSGLVGENILSEQFGNSLRLSQV